MIGRLTKGRAILITLVCIISVFSIALFIVINVSPLLISYPGSLHIGRSGINSDYRRLLAYLELPGQGLALKQIPLTAEAQSHFADVKRYVFLNELLMVVSTAVAWLVLRKEKRRQQLWQLLSPLAWGMSILAVVLTMVVVNFPSLFIAGHYLLFAKMNWLMNPRVEPIILLMPLSFFTSLFILWVCLVFFFLTVLWGYFRFTTGFTKFRS